MRYKILNRIFVGLETDREIEEGILQTHQCLPQQYRLHLGLDEDAPLAEVDRVLASYLGTVPDEELPNAYIDLIARLKRETN